MSYISELHFALQRDFPESRLASSDGELEGTVVHEGREVHLSTNERALAAMADAEAGYLAHVASNTPATGLANLISIHCEEALLTLDRVDTGEGAAELELFNPATGEVFPPQQEPTP